MLISAFLPFLVLLKCKWEYGNIHEAARVVRRLTCETHSLNHTHTTAHTQPHTYCPGTTIFWICALWYSEILPGFKLLFPTRCLLVSPVFHGSHLTWLLSWPTDPNSAMVLQRTPNPFSLFSRTCRYNEIGFDVEITFATAGFLRSLSGIQM